MNPTHLDQAGRVREEDRPDLTRLQDWLTGQLEGCDKNMQIRQFKGGASNLTFQLDCEGGPSYILRMPPRGAKAKSAHNMEREFRILETLKPVYPYVPTPLVYCGDEQVIGNPFYLMERLEGIIPRRDMPKGIQMTPAACKQLCENALDAWVALHQLDLKATGLDAFGKGAGYVDRQIEGWCERYRQARTYNTPRFEEVMDWLLKNKPTDEARLSFIHNDFRLDNLVLDANDPTQVIGVLDWELATVGDPLMDIGSSLAYWTEAKDSLLLQWIRRQPTHLPGMMTRRELLHAYEQKTGLPTASFTFYEVYGLFRLAGIAQQIYYRYHHRQTRNPAFRWFWVWVHFLHGRCKRLMRNAR
jgi:aminoglycoside phosphotransferase (APT) family kinase protein